MRQKVACNLTKRSGLPLTLQGMLGFMTYVFRFPSKLYLPFELLTGTARVSASFCSHVTISLFSLFLDRKNKKINLIHLIEMVFNFQLCVISMKQNEITNDL